MIRGEFNKVQITPERSEFISKDGNYRVGQDSPIFVNETRYQPDIIVYKNDKPILFIEIKLYLNAGIKDLEKDLDKLKNIGNQYPSAKCLFISYKILPIKGKIYKKLIDEINSHKSLYYLILQENDQPLNEFFKEFI